MKKYLLALICCACISIVSAQNNQWTWMGGENNYTPAGYGIKGMADSANRPGTRTGAASWKDASGNFWIFGGLGSTENSSGELNDLWTFNPVTKWWTWISGDSISKQKAVYGVRGIAAPNNKPGAFSHPVGWTDALGKFWMYSNVLWKYDPSTEQWTWISGDTVVTRAVYGIKGGAAAANKPGTTNSFGWADTSGNFWLYGNVVWKYNIAAGVWTWVHGDTTDTRTVYGIRGVPNPGNTPGTRKEVTGWADGSGKFWFLGGNGTVSTPLYYRGGVYYNNGNLNDLWNYDPGTNLWTWVSGDTLLFEGNVAGTLGTAAPANRPGARSTGVSWTDSSGNFWLFGGYTFNPYFQPTYYNSYNDLWKYDTSTNLWTCFRNTSYAIIQDSFSVKRRESLETKPAKRSGAVGWIDASSNLWMFGGSSYDPYPTYHMNDLLKYNTKTDLWALEFENKDGRLYGLYGQKGVAGADNMPGGRHDAASWTDSTGNLWLFGGLGYGSSGYFYFQNDLWKRNNAGIWTWINGLTTPVPSARCCMATWTDAAGNLLLFGGTETGSTRTNDMWRYVKNTNEWTQISSKSGSSFGIKGQPHATNKPRVRQNATSWKDNAGRLWLFGGDAGNVFNFYVPFTECNDLWNYDPAINQWTWVSGDSTAGQSGIYGKKGIADAASKPQARQGAVSWTDLSGNVWIYGGYHGMVGDNTYNKYYYLNDLWKYNAGTNVWTWMSGDSAADRKGVYGTMGIPNAASNPGGRYDAVSWTDDTGKLWLFGGEAVGGTGTLVGPQYFLNDLWCYDTGTNLWTWFGGDSSINKNSISGKIGTATAAHKPGARSGSIAWKDKSGDFWLMGGIGYGWKGTGFLNDIWKFSPSSLALPVNFLHFSAGLQTTQVLLNWRTADEQQCAYYAVQRSRDGAVYDSIGVVTAAGKLHSINEYGFVDHLPFAETNHYRLKQVDINGRYTLSEVRKVVWMKSLDFSVAILQNPATGLLRINIQSNQSMSLQMEVRDACGRLLISEKQPVSRGSSAHTVPVRNLAAGTYFLTSTSGKTTITKKFIMQ